MNEPLLPQPWEEDEKMERTVNLMDMEPSVKATNTGLARVEAALDSALGDLRTMAMSAPVEIMERGLAEYDARRTKFRDWLLSKMEEGVHFGIVPGIKIPPNVDKTRWKMKPSLYKAGAEMICDLLGIKVEFVFDEDLARQLGEAAKGLVIFRCIGKDNHSQVIGYGRGACGLKDESNPNASIKKAQKRSQVDFVLTTFGLSDLYTQDIEDGPPPPLNNPAQQQGAPKSAPRGETNADKKPPFNKLVLDWRQAHGFEDAYPSTQELAKMKPSDREIIKQRQAEAKPKFLAWAAEVLRRGDSWEPSLIDNWTMADIAAAQQALNEEFA